MAVAIVIALTGQGRAVEAAEVTSHSTVQLRNSVRRLNSWLQSSQYAEGWRKYLSLNVLDTQAAKGDAADLNELTQLLWKFSGGVDGLDRAEFNDVRIALHEHVAMLSRNRNFDLVSATADAMDDYRMISIDDLEAARDAAAYELALLKRYYRRNLSSRDRAGIFYELDLDGQIEFLESLEFELPPQISVGKITSMIRGEQDRLEEIEAKIDAMPVDDEEDDEGEGDDGDGEIELSLEGPGDPPPPSPDNGEETVEELEAQLDRIDERIAELKEMRADAKSKDAPRVKRRKEVLRQLAKYNSGYREVSVKTLDPYFVSTALAAERFNFLYFYGTDDNLQEEYLERIESLKELLERSPDLSDREVHGEVGKLVQWFESAGQVPELVSAIRARYSNPNVYVGISSRIMNELGGRDVSDQQVVKDMFFGRIVRGTANVTGNVQISLQPDPNQANVTIQLLGSVTSQTYSRERKFRIDTTTSGSYQASRKVYANVGGMYATDVSAYACMSAAFCGISSQLDFVQKLAAKQFAKMKPKSDRESSRRIREQVMDQFSGETDAALEDGQAQFEKLLDRSEQVAAYVPNSFIRTLQDRIEIVASKTNQGSLGAPTVPASLGGAHDLRLKIHETLLSNYIDPVLAGRTFTNEELRELAEERIGVELPEPEMKGDVDAVADGDNKGADEIAAEEEFSITFARVRPVQFIFDQNKISIVVTGTRFAQPGRSIRAGLRIKVTVRIVNRDGKMVVVPEGKAEIDYLNPEKKDTKIVAFRGILEKRINAGLDDGVIAELPPNLIPPKAAEDNEIAGKLRLSQLSFDSGWIYAAWTYGDIWSDMSGLTAIGYDQPRSPEVGDEVDGLEDGQIDPPLPDLEGNIESDDDRRQRPYRESDNIGVGEGA